MTEPKIEQLSPNISHSRDSVLAYVEQMFLISPENSVSHLESMARILRRRLEMFSETQQQELNSFYNTILNTAKDLDNKFQEFREAALATDTFDPTDPNWKASYIGQIEAQSKKLLLRAVMLNRTAIERYGLAESNEIMFMMTMNYIKQMFQYLQKNNQRLKPIDSNRQSRGYELDLLEETELAEESQNQEAALDEEPEHYFTITQNFIKNAPAEFDINLTQPYGIDLSRLEVYYVDTRKKIEVSITCGEGYQAFVSSCDEGDDYESIGQLLNHFTTEGFVKLLEESFIRNSAFLKLPPEEQDKIITESFEEMMRGVLTIARELGIPLKMMQAMPRR